LTHIQTPNGSETVVQKGLAVLQQQMATVILRKEDKATVDYI
jgi:hypothetical protein